MTNIEKSGIKITKLLQAKGFVALWVGGIVRNRLLMQKTDNLDIATDALPDEVEKILKRVKIKYTSQGKHFGSIVAGKVEITTFRSDGRSSNRRHPDEIQFIKDYLQDAKRRDFTINAFYYDPLTKQIYDPANGQKDLQLKLIRFIGDPRKRIDEDALRMLRAVRFAAQLGFKLEKNTFAAIKTRAKYLQSLSTNQINKEMSKIKLLKNQKEIQKLLKQTGLQRFLRT